jgi:hypothetical protein
MSLHPLEECQGSYGIQNHGGGVITRKPVQAHRHHPFLGYVRLTDAAHDGRDWSLLVWINPSDRKPEGRDGAGMRVKLDKATGTVTITHAEDPAFHIAFTLPKHLFP